MTTIAQTPSASSATGVVTVSDLRGLSTKIDETIEDFLRSLNDETTMILQVGR